MMAAGAMIAGQPCIGCYSSFKRDHKPDSSCQTLGCKACGCRSPQPGQSRPCTAVRAVLLLKSGVECACSHRQRFVCFTSSPAVLALTPFLAHPVLPAAGIRGHPQRAASDPAHGCHERWQGAHCQGARLRCLLPLCCAVLCTASRCVLRWTPAVCNGRAHGVCSMHWITAGEQSTANGLDLFAACLPACLPVSLTCWRDAGPWAC